MITVYTSATNGRDGLREQQCTDGAKFIAFVDAPSASPSVWAQTLAPDLCKSARRNARMCKILSHQYVDTEYSVWMDANVSLAVPARRLVDDYLADADLAVFRHRTRDCTYEEGERCGELGLDDRAVIAEQLRRYRANGLPGKLGLPETTVVIRRHGEAVRRFNDAWWSELCRHSVRDQISFMYAARSSGLRVHFITPTKFDHPYFSMTVRPPGSEPLHTANF